MPLHVRMGGVLVPSTLTGVARRGGVARPFGGGTPAEPPPTVPAADALGGLATEFDAATWDSGDWPWSYGPYSVNTAAGTLTLPAVGSYCGIDAGEAFDFRGKRAVVRSISFPVRGVGNGGLGSVESTMMVYDGTDTGTKKLAISLTQGQLTAQVNDVWKANIPFVAENMLWWQIRESGGTVYFEYSADGITWSTLWSESTPAWASSLADIQLHCGHWDEPSDPDSAWVIESYGYVPAERATTGLVLPGSAGSFASTPDANALDITGDIDIRVDATANWIASTTNGGALVSKMDGTASRAFLLRLHPSTDDVLQFIWSPTGSSATQVAVASSALPFTNGQRRVVRVTLDVDTGPGRVVRFEYGPSINGPWTLISQSTSTASTSIAAVTANLTVGAWNNAGDLGAFTGTIHRVVIRDGINGAAVVDADFENAWKVPGTHTDRTGNVWTLHGSAAIV